MAKALVFTSARLQRACAGLLMLAAAQVVLASCQPEPTSAVGYARVALAAR